MVNDEQECFTEDLNAVGTAYNYANRFCQPNFCIKAILHISILVPRPLTSTTTASSQQKVNKLFEKLHFVDQEVHLEEKQPVTEWCSIVKLIAQSLDFEPITNSCLSYE